MALRTVGFNTMLITSTNLEASYSSPEVLLSGHGLNVKRIHAGAVAAEMVTLQAFRDWANQGQVSPTMCGYVAITASTQANDPVPLLECRCPFPATIVENTDFSPEAGRQTGIAKEGRGGKLHLHGKVTPFLVVQPEVIGLAAAFYYNTGGEDG